MKFIVDESTGESVVNELRRNGYDVKSVQKSSPGLDDLLILEFAINEGRIVVTNDKDFGELIYRSGLPHKGVILFRLHDESVANRVRMMRKVLQTHGSQIKDSFIVVSERKIRIRRIK